MGTGIAEKDTDVPSLKDLGYVEFVRTPFRVRMRPEEPERSACVTRSICE
jgi:hypothetical protein